jgi:glycosyltransferase involved in cell wall biosynthesis
MKIWLLTVGEPLPVFDESPRLFRTGLLSRTLSGRGHDVTWWTSAFDHYGKRHRVGASTGEQWEGGELRLLRSIGYSKNVSPQRFLEHAGVANAFAREAKTRDRPDLIVASLPTIELAYEAVLYGASADVPVLLDVRDLWPDVLFNVLPARLRWIGRIALSWLTVKARVALTGCSGIVGISPAYLAWGLKIAGRAQGTSDGVFPLGYVRRSEGSALSPVVGQNLVKMGVDESRKLCWYVGSFGRTYDLAPVIRAARTLHDSNRTDVQFVISGDGELAPRWRRLADGLTNVVFTGWINADEIEWLRLRALVGLQPYAVGAPQGLANKLFEYISAGIPVVSSLKGENQDFLDRYRCGLTYDVSDGSDCLEEIITLIDNEPLRSAMGLRGRTAFDELFDGEVVLEQLADHCERVASPLMVNR